MRLLKFVWDLFAPTPPIANVWVVRFGNYYPAEIDSIWATSELAQTHCDSLKNSSYQVEKMMVGHKETK